MKNIYFKVMRTIMMTVLLSFALSSYAQKNPWEMVFDLKSTNAFYITESGNMLLADYLFEMDGGIYVSTDKGQTWEKAAVEDYNYNYFVENENYVFAAGAAACIARSADGGLTWELVGYADAVMEALGYDVGSTVCYAMAIHDGKLFVGDFNGGGVVYSEDDGNTWIATDINSLSFEIDGISSVENIYNLISYNGDLYAFGVYLVFKYLPETNSWEVIRNDSNFMAVGTVYQNKLCAGRCAPDENPNNPFIITLDENGEWGELPRPEGSIDNNVRAIYADGDNLFVGMQMTGLYFTDNAGLDWYAINDGIPYSTGYFFVPMFFDSDDEYIYLAAYEPDCSGTKNSGLYRLAKKDLPTYNGVEQLQSHDKVVFNGSQLVFDGNVEHITIYDVSGRTLRNKVSDNIVDLNDIQQGIYLYKAIVDGTELSGKFVK